MTSRRLAIVVLALLQCHSTAFFNVVKISQRSIQIDDFVPAASISSVSPESDDVSSTTTGTNSGSISKKASQFDDTNDNNNDLGKILSQLAGLTLEQSAAIQSRLPSKNPLTTHMCSEVLSWLTVRLGGGLDQTQLAAIATGHPPVLTYNIDNNLEPTVSFYERALNDDARLAAFLCESPKLLEYNVKKRLAPRLARVEEEWHSEKGSDILINEDMLEAIATKTDSRFDEWLKDHLVGDGAVKKNRDDKEIAFQQQQNEEDEHDGRPSSYVVVSNLQSGGNIGNILRSASIFGCNEFVVVGQKRYRLTGDHGSRFDLKRHHSWSHEEAKEYLHDRGVRIYGVEIMEGASPLMRYNRETGVVTFPFDKEYRGAAFVMGNEGQGLSLKQREICDEFLFIPQTRGGSTEGGGSASLNVACAATVVLQAYCTWAGYPDADREGEKFLAPSGESQRLKFRE